MSDQSQTTTNTPSEPRLCKMGCGFFGNGATDGCCSKCWRDLQKQRNPNEMIAAKPVEIAVEQSRPMDVEEPALESLPPAPVHAPVLSTVSKKKKPKASYKNIMATMMKGTTERDVEKEKESLRKVTGGGTFSKIDKI